MKADLQEKVQKITAESESEFTKILKLSKARSRERDDPNWPRASHWLAQRREGSYRALPSRVPMNNSITRDGAIWRGGDSTGARSLQPS